MMSRAAAIALAALCILAPDGAGVDAAAGDVTHLDVNTTITRPNFSVVGRVFVHGPSGNVAVGDISSYNDTSGAPAQKLEVDGSTMVRGDVVFDNSNGESSIVVLDANADALTVKDAGASPITYWKINSATSRLETHAPLHILDTRIEALDNSTTGLQFTAEAGNPLITLDTSDSAENVKVAYPLNALDTTDSCDTSVDGTCGLLASVVATGGLTVGKKTFMTGTVRVADTTDASVTNSETDVDGSVRLAGGLAVEKSAAIQAKLSVLSTTDGDASGIGAALYVKGGYHVGGDTYVGGDSMIELGGKNVKVSKSVTVTDSDTAPVTVATLRLKPGTSAALSLRLSCEWTGGAPASVFAEFNVHHNSGAAPEPSAAVTPRRLGLVRATQSVGSAADDGYFEFAVEPDDSGGAGVEKDFVVKVYTADAGSGNAPTSASAVMVARAEGDFESLT